MQAWVEWESAEEAPGLARRVAARGADRLRDALIDTMGASAWVREVPRIGLMRAGRLEWVDAEASRRAWRELNLPCLVENETLGSKEKVEIWVLGSDASFRRAAMERYANLAWALAERFALGQVSAPASPSRPGRI